MTNSFASPTICSPENDHTDWEAPKWNGAIDSHKEYTHIVTGKEIPIKYKKDIATSLTKFVMTLKQEWDDVWASPSIRLAPHPDGRLQLIDATDKWTTSENYLSIEFDGIPAMGLINKFISSLTVVGKITASLIGAAQEIYNPFVGNVQINPPSRSGTEFQVSVTPSKCVRLSDVSENNAAYWYLHYLYKNQLQSQEKTPEQAEIVAEEHFKTYLDNHAVVMSKKSTLDEVNAWKESVPQLIRNDYNIYLHEVERKKVAYVRVRNVNPAGTLCPINFIENGERYSTEIMPNLVGRVSKFPITSSSQGIDNGWALLGPQVFSGTQVSSQVDTILQGSKFLFAADIGRSLNGFKALTQLLDSNDDFDNIRIPDYIETMLSDIPSYPVDELGKPSEFLKAKNRPKYVLDHASKNEVTARAYFNMCGWSLDSGNGGTADAFPKRVCPADLTKDGALDENYIDTCREVLKPPCTNDCLPGSDLTIREFVGTGKKHSRSSTEAHEDRYLAPLTSGLLSIADNVLTYNDAKIATFRYQSRKLEEGKVVKTVWYALKELASFYSAYFYCRSKKRRLREYDDILRKIYLAYTDHGLYFGPALARAGEYSNVTGWIALPKLPWYASWLNSRISSELEEKVVKNVEGHFGERDRERTYCGQLQSTTVETNYSKIPVLDLPPYHYFGFFGRSAGDRDLTHPANGIKMLYKYGWDFMSGGSLSLPRFADRECVLKDSELRSDCARFFIMKLAKDAFGPAASNGEAREGNGQFFRLVKTIFQESEENSSFWMNYFEESSAAYVERQIGLRVTGPVKRAKKTGHRGWIHYPHMTVLDRMINAGFQALDPDPYFWGAGPAYFHEARKFCSSSGMVGYRMATKYEVEEFLKNASEKWKDQYFWVSDRCDYVSPPKLSTGKNSTSIVLGVSGVVNKVMSGSSNSNSIPNIVKNAVLNPIPRPLLWTAESTPEKVWKVLWNSKTNRSEAICANSSKSDTFHQKRAHRICVRQNSGHPIIE